MSEEIGSLIWTEDDVIYAMESIGIDLTDENIERAIKASTGTNMEYPMEEMNREIFDAVRDEFSN